MLTLLVVCLKMDHIFHLIMCEFVYICQLAYTYHWFLHWFRYITGCFCVYLWTPAVEVCGDPEDDISVTIRIIMVPGASLIYN